MSVSSIIVQYEFIISNIFLYLPAEGFIHIIIITTDLFNWIKVGSVGIMQPIMITCGCRSVSIIFVYFYYSLSFLFFYSFIDIIDSGMDLNMRVNNKYKTTMYYRNLYVDRFGRYEKFKSLLSYYKVTNNEKYLY